MEKTFHKQDLSLVEGVLNDVRSVREGKLQSFMLAQDNAKKISVFTTGATDNCRVVIGESNNESGNEEFFGLAPEDISAGISNSGDRITITASLKSGTAKFKSNTRQAYRPIIMAEPHIKSRLTIFNDNKGDLLFKIKPSELSRLCDCMKVGSDSEVNKTHMTMFKLTAADKLEYYKYSTDSTVIFGGLNIIDGATSHNSIQPFDNTFSLLDDFPNIVRSLIGVASKEETGRLIELYFNGEAVTMEYVTERNVSVAIRFNGITINKEIPEMCTKMCNPFTSKIADIALSITELKDILRDVDGTTNSGPCFLHIENNVAKVESTAKVGEVPVYENSIPNINATINDDYAKKHPVLIIPVTTSPFLGILDTYTKFDIAENDQLNMRVFLLATQTQGKTNEAYLTEITTESFTGRMVAKSWTC